MRFFAAILLCALFSGTVQAQCAGSCPLVQGVRTKVIQPVRTNIVQPIRYRVVKPAVDTVRPKGFFYKIFSRPRYRTSMTEQMSMKAYV